MMQYRITIRIKLCPLNQKNSILIQKLLKDLLRLHKLQRSELRIRRSQSKISNSAAWTDMKLCKNNGHNMNNKLTNISRLNHWGISTVQLVDVIKQVGITVIIFLVLETVNLILLKIKYKKTVNSHQTSMAISKSKAFSETKVLNKLKRKKKLKWSCLNR